MHCLERISAMNDRAYEKWLLEQNNIQGQVLKELSEILSRMEGIAELVLTDTRFQHPNTWLQRNRQEQ